MPSASQFLPSIHVMVVSNPAVIRAAIRFSVRRVRHRASIIAHEFAASYCYRFVTISVPWNVRRSPRIIEGRKMDSLSLFGLFAVTAMLVCYALEDRNRLFILGFAGACALGSLYGFLQGAWPFGLVEAVWAGVALRRWIVRRPARA